MRLSERVQFVVITDKNMSLYSVSRQGHAEIWRKRERERDKEREKGREIELMYKETWREKENVSFNTAAKRNITLSPLFPIQAINSSLDFTKYAYIHETNVNNVCVFNGT